MKTSVLIVAIVLGLSGCSSIISKSEYSVAINSQPQKATFTIENKAGQKVHSGVTPASVTLKSSSGYFSGETYTITFQKKGYSDKTFTMTSTLDGWYIGNIVFGGLIGWLVIDPATGAMYNLPKRVDVSLDQAVTGTSNDQITIASIDNLSAADRERLVLIN